MTQRYKISDIRYDASSTPEEQILHLEEKELLLGKAGYDYIKVAKGVFDDFVKGTFIQIVFSDIADSNLIYEYAMVSEDSEGIVLEFLGYGGLLIEEQDIVNRYWLIKFIERFHTNEESKSSNSLTEIALTYLDMLRKHPDDYYYIELQQIDQYEGGKVTVTLLDRFEKGEG